MNGARQNEHDKMSVKRLVNYLEQTVSERFKLGIRHSRRIHLSSKRAPRGFRTCTQVLVEFGEYVRWRVLVL